MVPATLSLRAVEAVSEALLDITSSLGAALSQSLPSDCQTMMNRVREAEAAASALRRVLRGMEVTPQPVFTPEQLLMLLGAWEFAFGDGDSAFHKTPEGAEKVEALHAALKVAISKAEAA